MIENYGAPGGIRTPDHLVRSQVLEKALHTINIGISVLRLSHKLLSFGKFYCCFEEFLTLSWDKGVTTVGFNL